MPVVAEVELGQSDSAFAGCGVEKKGAARFFEDRGVAKLTDWAVGDAAKGRLQRLVGTFPRPLGPQDLDLRTLLPLLPGTG